MTDCGIGADNEVDLGKGGKPQNPQLRGPLEKKIDQLYHHASDLKHSQHIMEHLAAGSKGLDQPDALEMRQEEVLKNEVQEPRKTVIRIPHEHLRDHSLARDETASMDCNVAEHELSIDQRVPGDISTEEHALSDDPTVNRELSPTSHDLPSDIHIKVAEWTEPHSIYPDYRGTDSATKKKETQPQEPLTYSSTYNKSVSAAGLKDVTGKAPPALIGQQSGQDHSQFPPSLQADYVSWEQKGGLRQANISATKQGSLPPVPLEHQPRSDQHHSPQQPEERDVSVERAGLRKVTGNSEQNRKKTGTEIKDVSSLRQQLRKVEKSEDKPVERQPTPPVVRWRRSLSKPPRTPKSHQSRRKSCTFCHPSEASSSRQTEGTRVGEGGTTAETDHVQDAWSPPAHARVRLKQIEQSLANQSGEDLHMTSQGVTQRNEAAQMREVGMTKRCRRASHTPLEERQSVVEIHNPQPQLAPNHVCAWRTRYMDLSTEVEHLKSESGSRSQGHDRGTSEREPAVGRADAGVGTALARHECPEVSIEGLTIVMHMRGKDDLVINTDLKGDS